MSFKTFVCFIWFGEFNGIKLLLVFPHISNMFRIYSNIIYSLIESPLFSWLVFLEVCKTFYSYASSTRFCLHLLFILFSIFHFIDFNFCLVFFPLQTLLFNVNHLKNLYWICYDIASALCFLVGSMWDFSSPTRDWAHTPGTGRLTTGPPEKSLALCFNWSFFFFPNFLWYKLWSLFWNFSVYSKFTVLVAFHKFWYIVFHLAQFWPIW